MVSASGLRDSYVSMVCSRGVPKVTGSRNPNDCDNHFFAWCVPYVNIIKPEIAKEGASAWISDEVKRIPQDSVNPRNKKEVFSSSDWLEKHLDETLRLRFLFLKSKGFFRSTHESFSTDDSKPDHSGSKPNRGSQNSRAIGIINNK